MYADVLLMNLGVRMETFFLAAVNSSHLMVAPDCGKRTCACVYAGGRARECVSARVHVLTNLRLCVRLGFWPLSSFER